MSKVNVKLLGQTVSVEKGTTLLELSKDIKDHYETEVVAAVVNNSVKEMSHKIEEDSDVTLLDLTDTDGYKAYQRSLSLLLLKAVKDVLKEQDVDVIVEFAINNGFYCRLKNTEPMTEALLAKVKARMKELVWMDLTIEKPSVKIDKARMIFEKQNMLDKLELFKYRRSSYVNLCRLDDYYDYYYGHMVPSTGCLKVFDLFLYDEGFVLQYATKSNPKEVAPFHPDEKLFNTLKVTAEWGKIMDVESVGDLNRIISSGGLNKLILVTESLMEKRIAQIADKIIEAVPRKQFVFIAGPSSSGKTTFAHRLSIQLMAQGVKPKIISLDNYFVNRDDTPRDEFGNHDFECLEALDLKQFSQDMTKLLGGSTVDIPEFNFVKGQREYKGNFVTLDEKSVLIFEGIHGLNDKLSSQIPNDSKYKIYISALTALNVDNHNRIPTTDARLIRRMVRDYQYRGASAVKTIGMWDSVRRGEERHIFPFQEQADAMFNSTLIYELAVLKQYAEPLLFSVPVDSPQYIEAKRYIKFLDYFLGVSSAEVPNNSILREFIGGSCF